MTRILLAYTTNSGSTAEVAQAIAEVFLREGSQVDVRRLEEVQDLTGYDAVVVGAPMILGWHSAAVRFLKKHQRVLATLPVAYFCTLLSLTQTSEANLSMPVCIDPDLARPPNQEGHLGIKERYATLSNYLRPLKQAAPGVHPKSVGFFGGKLEMFRLRWWQMLFVMAIIQAQPGDFRNTAFIEEWAAGLYPQLVETG